MRILVRWDDPAELLKLYPRGTIDTDCRDCDVDKTLDHQFHSSHKDTGAQGRHDDTSVLLLERTA